MMVFQGEQEASELNLEDVVLPSTGNGAQKETLPTTEIRKARNSYEICYSSYILSLVSCFEGHD